jgi:hypothetical protein
VSWIHVRSFFKKIHELLYSKSINYFNNLSYKSSMYKDNSLGEESGLASSPISWCSSKGRAYKYYLQLYFTLKIDIATYYSYICILCFFFPSNTRNSEKKKKKKKRRALHFKNMVHAPPWGSLTSTQANSKR